MLHFSEDLLCIVLSKLSVKSLFRFRCVSKLWLNLIDSPYFFDLHRNYSEQNSTKIMVLGINIDCKPLYGRVCSMHTLDFKSQNNAKVIEREIPHTRYPPSRVRTCNSLISLVCGYKDRVFIWNPATHKHREVELVNKGGDFHDFGLGYDYKTDDYKLMILRFRTIDEETRYTFQVYSLKSNKWGLEQPCVIRKLSLFPLYADGALYWITRCDPLYEWGVKKRIVVFDLATEQWSVLRLPEPIRDFYRLSNRGRSLCVSCYGTNGVEFWVMKKEGINSYSWSKLDTIKENHYHFDLEVTPPLIINNKGHMKWYDIEKETIEDFDILGVSKSWKPFTWYESLIRV